MNPLKPLLTLCAALLLSGPGFAADAKQEELFELGKADQTVRCTKEHRRIAEEMAWYLKKVFGRNYPVKIFAPEDRKEPGIFIGIRPEGVHVDADEKREFCGQHITGSQLYLFGNRDAKRLHGTMFAVYDFLERECGVRWLWPGELGTVADPMKPIRLKTGTRIFVPVFERRMTNSFNYGNNYMPVRELKAQKSWLDHQKVGESLFSSQSGFQHAFGHLMTREQYGREHPEYFALVSPRLWVGDPKPDKPTRRSDPNRPGSWQLCTSNPDVRRIIAEKLAAPKDGLIRSISPNDGYGFCECAECLKQDGKPRPPRKHGIPDLTNRIYDFAADVARQVKKLNPNARIGMFSYSIFDGVPDGKIDFPGNMYLATCYMIAFLNEEELGKLENHLRGLAATGARIIARESWGNHYIMDYPILHSRRIERDLQLLHKLKAAGVYGEIGKSFAARATDIYLVVKMTWDPTLKRDDILRDFCLKGFGPKAGPVMLEFFNRQEDETEKIVRYLNANPGANFRYYNNGYASRNLAMAAGFDAKYQKMCLGYLNRAAKLADTPERKARVEFFRRGVLLAKFTSDAIEANSDLAAIGVNMPLTQPSAKTIRMEKKSLIKLARAALKAHQERNRYFTLASADNAFGGYVDRSQRMLRVRPWGIMAEKTIINLTSGRFNYLVNGAFEYTAYSWKTTGEKGAELTFTSELNHDADDNYMVKNHDGQGISLQLALPAGSSAELVNLRKVSPEEPQEVSFRLFAKCESDPLRYMTVEFAGKTLRGIPLPPEAEDGSSWREIRFERVKIPAGDHVFKIKFHNPDKTAVKLNLDDLVLRMREVTK
ncbi:MAG: DUF4838 domain-containing protein [Lentisphaeria bacterium]|nr:DUF4838 domain-containing protein [Lentisphaeria bacterium]